MKAVKEGYGHWEFCHKFDPSTYEGFVYKITNLETDEFYIGKKNFRSNRTLPPLKGKIRKRHVVKESDWRTYKSSQAELQQAIDANPDIFLFEILELCPTRLSLTYAEAKHLFANSVLDNPKSLNRNILGRFYNTK